jgi:hypothetical protein
MLIKNSLVLLVFIFIGYCTGGYHDSHVYRLQDLFLKEEGIVAVLQKAYSMDNKQTQVADYLNRFKSREQELPILEDKSNLNEHLLVMMDKLVGNPVHVYTLLYRYVVLLPRIQEKLTTELRGFIESIITNQNGQAPTWLDLDGAALSLARIQFTYKLDPQDISKGIINGIQTEARLNSDELVDIAERRISGMTPSKPGHPKDYAVAFEFAEAALDISSND